MNAKIGIVQNRPIDLNSMTLQNAALTLIGAVCVNASVFLLFYKLYRGRFLRWLGRNTMPIFAFNYAANAYLRWLWEVLFPGTTLSWWLLSILNVPCLLGAVLLVNAVRGRLRPCAKKVLQKEKRRPCS